MEIDRWKYILQVLQRNSCSNFKSVLFKFRYAAFYFHAICMPKFLILLHIFWNTNAEKSSANHLNELANSYFLMKCWYNYFNVLLVQTKFWNSNSYEKNELLGLDNRLITLSENDHYVLVEVTYNMNIVYNPSIYLPNQMFLNIISSMDLKVLTFQPL